MYYPSDAFNRFPKARCIGTHAWQKDNWSIVMQMLERENKITTFTLQGTFSLRILYDEM